jgi:hypothetical protein
VRALLVRGMIAGLVGGLAYFLFAYLFGEGPIDAAIAYEERVAATAGEASTEAPLVSRGIQSTLGLGVAALVYGVVIGGMVALAYASVVGRVGRLGPRATAAAIAAIGFVAVALVPFVKYPANPPASTIDETVGQRTGPYVLLMILSVVFAVGAVMLGRSVAARLGGWNATLTASATYLVAVGALATLLPRIAETPADFPATVLYDFRLAAIAGHLVLWTVTGLVFGALIEGRSRQRSGNSAGAVIG